MYSLKLNVNWFQNFMDYSRDNLFSNNLYYLCYQVLVNIKAAGVNPVDTYIRSGTYARKPTLPYTPGSDGAGVVHTVGQDVKEVKVSH